MNRIQMIRIVHCIIGIIAIIEIVIVDVDLIYLKSFTLLLLVRLL